MLTKSKKLLNAVKKLYTKVTGGKTTKSNDLPTVIDSMAENYVGGGSGGTTAYHDVQLFAEDINSNINFNIVTNSRELFTLNSFKEFLKSNLNFAHNVNGILNNPQSTASIFLTIIVCYMDDTNEYRLSINGFKFTNGQLQEYNVPNAPLSFLDSFELTDAVI